MLKLTASAEEGVVSSLFLSLSPFNLHARHGRVARGVEFSQQSSAPAFVFCLDMRGKNGVCSPAPVQVTFADIPEELALVLNRDSSMQRQSKRK